MKYLEAMLYGESLEEKGKTSGLEYKQFKRGVTLYLTENEAKSMNLLLEGHTNTSIAKCLGLSEKSIEFYFKNIKIKLSHTTKNQIVRIH